MQNSDCSFFNCFFCKYSHILTQYKKKSKNSSLKLQISLSVSHLPLKKICRYKFSYCYIGIHFANIIQYYNCLKYELLHSIYWHCHC